MTVKKLNELLEAELGSSPIYRWIRCDSHDFRWPLRVLNRDGSEVMDFYCACGTNVRVHKPSCKFTYPRFRIEMKNIFQSGTDYENSMARLQFYALAASQPSPDDWETRFGSLNRPAVLWMPVTSPELPSPGYCLAEKPDLAITRATIGMVREFRSEGVDALAERKEAEQTKREEDEVTNNTDMLNDLMTLQLKPGSRSGAVSMPAVADSSTRLVNRGD